jgi:hypothetical protein
MKSKSLSKTNQYLKRDAGSGRFITRNIASSTAVETKKGVDQVIKRATELRSSKLSTLLKKRAS